MWMREIIVGKTADVYQGAGYLPRFGMLYMHDEGGRMLQDQPLYTQLLQQLRLVCVCPHARESWWTDRICPGFDPHVSVERHLLESILPFFRERWGVTARAIGVAGIGMGGQGALRLAFRHPQLFPAAVGIAPALDFHERYGQGTPLDAMYDSKEQCRQDTALMHVRPDEYPPHLYFCCDPEDEAWYRGNDRLHEKLSALGIEHTADLSTQAGGHSEAYFEHMAEPALRFLVEGLEKESRRLL
jgi:S-formylglutathione hydrolase